MQILVLVSNNFQVLLHSLYKTHKILTAGPGKKAKRVSDVNALGGSKIINQPSLTPNQNFQGINNMQQSPANFYTPNTSPLNYAQQQQEYQPEFQNNFQYVSSNHHQQQQHQPMAQFDMSYQSQKQASGQPNFAMFQQPIVQDMAFKLADQGKELVHKEFEKYVSVSKLKYYFAVDNRYVLNKLRLIFFPFAQRDWSLKFDQGKNSE